MKTNYIFKKSIPFTLLLLILFSFKINQNKYSDSISGIVYDEESKPLANVEIINLNNNFVVLSKEDGSFSIKGHLNDKLKIIFPEKITKSIIADKVSDLEIHFELYKDTSVKNIPKTENPYKNKIKGQVSDSFGTLPGATVVVVETKQETVTDFDGYYGIDAKIGDFIEVSFAGKKKIKLKIKNPVTDIILNDDFVGDEIVLTGIVGKARKKDATTSSYVAVKSEEMSMKVSPKTTNALSGKVAGLTITDKETSKTKTIVLRGSRSISAKTSGVSEIITPNQKAGQLTSGEVNDFSHWEYWQGLSEYELNQWKNHWKFNPTFRYSVVLTNQEGYPIINKTLHLINESNEKIWTSRTDNTGRAELWYNPNDISIIEVKENLSIVDDSKNIISDKAIEFHDGINLYQYNENCNTSNKLNIAFMIDATGSMGDEISYLQAELNDVINRTKKALPNVDLTMGSVFYRDTTDEYLIKKFDFTSDISNVISFIQKQNANGGGDAPEAVIEGLEASINQISWDEDAKTKLLFILLDAPPHYDVEKVLKLQELAEKAAEKGIRIIPVAASGIDKSTEYLMRAMALETNGTYLFITNHSGIGNDHIEPSTESYKVEMLNDLILRVILQYSQVKDCISNDNYPKNTKIEDQIKDDKIIKWSYYPNPTSGLVTVNIDKEVTELYVFDTTGKLIFYKNKKTKQYQLDLSGLPNAIYYLKVIVGDKELFGKIIKKI